MRTQQSAAICIDRTIRVRSGSGDTRGRDIGTGHDLAIRRVREQGWHDGFRIMKMQAQTARDMSIPTAIDMQKDRSSLLPADRY
ncbi:hypothetical protein [Burkholderia anthina]|uniref:hypothetical protein n=1 Tax=Burkholderia anthina TaxID=179879 RepID=UPI001AA018C1|nr:hypothetical protein [Burkholderia anthina]QTD94694.1 hypothetical protein J4G50_36745 [Burkholderia anthina]